MLDGELLVDGGGALGRLREGLGEAGLQEEVALPHAHVGGGWADTHAQK